MLATCVIVFLTFYYALFKQMLAVLFVLNKQCIGFLFCISVSIFGFQKMAILIAFTLINIIAYASLC